MKSKPNIDHISGCNPIILDFIRTRDDLNGFGYFRGDRDAIQYAQMVSTNQERKFRKHGIVPRALVEMMAQYWVCQEENNPTRRNITYSEFLTIFMRGPYKKGGRQVCEKFYRDLLCADMPWLKRSFAMYDGFYEGHEKQSPSKQKKEVKSKSH